MAKLLHEEQDGGIEFRIVRPDGEIRSVEGLRSVDDTDGSIRVIGTILDITERKRAEEEVRRSERRLLNAQRIASVGDWSFDVVRNEAHWSDQMHRIFGLFPQRPVLTYKNFLRLVHPDDRATVREMSREALHGGGGSSIDYRVVRPDGEVRYVHSEYEIERDASGRTTGLVGTLQDVTELRQKEQEVRRSEERFRALVQNSMDVVTVMDAEANIVYYSPSVETVLGYKPEEFVGKNAPEAQLIHPEDLPGVKAVFDYLVENPGVNYSMELRMKHADGSWRTLEATANNLLDNPSIGGIVINSRDITERKTFERQLEHQAFHDDLTGLPNRTLFMDRLEHALSRADRDKGSVAVLFMDLDNFKVVNDSLGHQAGDELLVAVAERLRGCFGPADTVARLGGDEFIVLLEEVTEESDATGMAEHLANRLQEPFEVRGESVHLTASVGVAFGVSSDGRAEELLRKADIAMYRAKHRGKAHYRVFDVGMDAEARERLNLENDLRVAIENGELKVFYQPEVLLESGEITGFEALLRWEHPDRGMVPPSVFIPIAEETELIVPLGRQVLWKACRQAREWQDRSRNTAPVMVSVNLSAKQFRDPDLAQEVARILRETGLNEHLLCLEVTETTAMEERRPTIERLDGLKNLGVKLAIDDFGTGYSSLSYLKHFPVDYLKIDRSIITGLEKDSPHWAIVLATITLAHTLGLRVVAEGVETAEEFAKLRSLRCDLAQGYYFSRALPGDAATALLSSTPYAPYAQR